MKIGIDYRERNKIPLFKDYIKKRSKFITDIEVITAESGDVFTLDGLVGIERKAEDFLPSIYNDQLDKQLKELSDNFSYPFLFVEYEGVMDVILQNPGTNPEVIIGFLASVLGRHKVTVMFVGQFFIPFTCKVIERFYDGRTPVKEVSYSPIRRAPTSKEVKLDIISRLPKIGSLKGNKLLNHFDNSILNIANATEEELEEVPGIGKKLAKEIKEVLQ